ncbi:hypothetical protein AB0K09_28480 [Streptomyces sp. NPDC049577]|uniref:hypothetical protein n=1 Tax=Streptomyces sp. NPDC049577 TaxID=3155153 RepID=UPI003433D115
MNSTNPHTTATAVTVLALAVVLLLAAALGAVAGWLARMDGAGRPAALSRAGAAFGGALTVISAVLTLLHSVLR